MGVFLIVIGVFLLIVNLYMLFGGAKTINKVHLEMLEFEENIDEYASNKDKSANFLFKMLFLFLFGIFYIFVYFLFISLSLTVDTLLIPTIIMIIWFVYNIVKARINKKKTKEEQKVRLRKNNFFVKTVLNLLTITYICYILFLLVV